MSLPTESSIIDPDCDDPFVAKSFYIDTVIRNLLRLHFAKDEKQVFPGLQDLYWAPDNRSHGAVNDPFSMRIDLSDTWNPSRTGSSPGLIIRANDLASIRIGIADRHQFPTSSDLTGTETYTRVYAGSVTVFCVSRVPRQSRLLSLEVASYLQQFSQQFRKRLHLARVQISSIGMVKPLREQPTILVAPVVLEYAFFETWHVQPAARKIKRFEHQTSS